MAPASTNWVSFALPPVETLIRPYGYEPAYPFPYLASSSSPFSNEDTIGGYGIHFPPVKLEDLLLIRSPPAVDPSSEILTEAQESSSMTTVAHELRHHHSDESRDPPATIAFALAGDHSAGSEVVDSAPEACQVLALSCLSPDSGGPRHLAAVAPARRAPATTMSGSQRTSIYRGVTRHRWTGRYEAHLWDNTCTREGQKRKGRQVYLGGYDKEEKAARAYDLAALKYWGPNATTNFPVNDYTREIEQMADMTKQEFIASLRRKSSGFSRGASIYRGVTRHHQHGRWQARIGRVAGNKDLYLGTFATEEEAAEAYDVAAIKFRGANAVTNFEHSRYDVEAIANTDLPIGASAKRIKQVLQANSNSSSQLVVAGSAAPQAANESSDLLHSLLQLRTTSGPLGSLAYDYSFSNADMDLCHRSFYRLPAANDHTCGTDNLTGISQWAEGGFLQLTHLALPQ